MNPEDDNKIVNINNIRSEEIRSLQEMIDEALMDTDISGTTSRLDSGYTDADYVDQDQDQNQNHHHLMYLTETDDGNLTLGKLFLKFKNLDFRLSRIEEVISKQNDDLKGKKRSTTMHTRSNYPGFISDQETSPSRLLGITTIDPILTNSNDMLSLGQFQSSSSSAYSLPALSRAKVKRKDEIKVN